MRAKRDLSAEARLRAKAEARARDFGARARRNCAFARPTSAFDRIRMRLSLRPHILEDIDLDAAGQHGAPGLQVGLQPHVARDALAVDLH
jgi:hypothetical protein